MLRIVVGEEGFDESTSTFTVVDPIELTFEHSLVSLSKWESFWKKPFLGKTEKTSEETEWYVRAMCLSPGVSEETFQKLSKENYDELAEYINDSMTATTFYEDEDKPSKETITSELIYYWMVAMAIPFECQEWHLSRLLTLCRVCSIKSSPPKKLSRAQIAERNRALNEKRRKELGTTG